MHSMKAALTFHDDLEFVRSFLVIRMPQDYRRRFHQLVTFQMNRIRNMAALWYFNLV